MYASHVPAINAAMRADANIFRRGIMFAILSIRQPVIIVPEQLEELAEYQSSAPGLFGFKLQSYLWLDDAHNLATLWLEVCAIPLTDPTAVILALLRVPGLGIVKAGFVAQFLGFDVACLDTRNIKREGRNPRAFRTDGKPPHKLAPKVRKYVKETSGKAAHYWDTWCTQVAEVYDMTPAAVSALHMAIVPDNFVPF